MISYTCIVWSYNRTISKFGNVMTISNDIDSLGKDEDKQTISITNEIGSS